MCQSKFFAYICNVNKRLLYEISIIRPLIIFLLVVYHSLCVFTGGWVPPQGVPSNDVYWWLGHLISGFRIETIAFVGGYVFCYQCVELGRRQGFLAFVWKKFKRLIIPCFVFGIAYYLLFRFNATRFTWRVAFWRVANGIGHLWFLPMLFWCFLACWLADRLLQWLHEKHEAWYRPVGWVLLVALAGVSLLRVTGLKMGLSRAPYFLFYFYLGYWLRALRGDGRGVREGEEHPTSVSEKPREGLEAYPSASEKHSLDVSLPSKEGTWTVVALWGVYVVFLLLHLQATHLYLPGCGFKCPRWLQGCSQTVLRLMTLGHTAGGILAVYATTTLWLRRYRTEEAQPSGWLRECSRLCYGVYVLHMFFMQPIYFFSGFPQWCCGSAVGVWLMPWAVLAVTLALSVAGTWLLLKMRVGRFLIG